jgi:hypothetical protein
MLMVFGNCCLFLLFQENIAALEDEKKANPSAILANALLGRFDLAIPMSFSRVGPSRTREHCFIDNPERLLKPVGEGAAGPVFYRPNLNEVGPHLAMAYNIVLQEYAMDGNRTQ